MSIATPRAVLRSSSEYKRKGELRKEFKKILPTPILPILQEILQVTGRPEARKPLLRLVSHLISNEVSPKT